MEEGFSVRNTNCMKGVALILLVVHHLFTEIHPAIASMYYNGQPLYTYFGIYAKVCVAIFTILSGYGLYKTSSPNMTLKQFYIKRFTKFYLSYWVIFIIFVAVGFLFFNFGIRWNEYYNGNYATIYRDILGIAFLWGNYGLNPTWWFVSAIVIFYLLLPLIRVLIDKYPKITLLLSFLSLFVNVAPYYNTHFNPYISVQWLIFPFVLGIFLAKIDGFYRLKEFKKHNIIKYLIYLILLVAVAYWRKNGTILVNAQIDGIFGLIIIVIMYELFDIVKFLQVPFNFLGKHSMNIFLFHTFIYYYFIPDFIYSFKYSILILLVLLFISLIISVGIEKLKYIVGINKLYSFINKSVSKPRREKSLSTSQENIDLKQ